MKTIEENNRMIAEFMSGQKVTTHHNQYYVSWNELMPVVEKISQTFGGWDYEDERRLEAEEIFYIDNMFSEFLQNDINAVFGRVVQFIEWYNEQK